MIFNKRCIQTVTEQDCRTGRDNLHSSLLQEAAIRAFSLGQTRG